MTSGQHDAGSPALVPPCRFLLTLDAKQRQLIDPHAQLVGLFIVSSTVEYLCVCVHSAYIYLNIYIT